MKILFIDQYNKIGGGQTVLLQLIDVALSEKHTIGLLIPPGGEIESHINSEVTIFPLKDMKIGQKKGVTGYFKLFFFTFSFLRYLKIFKDYDLIYVNGPRCFIPVSFVSLFIRKKIIYHIHLNHSNLEKKIIAFISKLKNTFKIIANSEFIYKKTITSVSASKLYLLENSLSQKYDTLSFINRFQNSEKLNFAVIGRVSPEKGQHIIPEIAKLFPENKFYIVGNSDFASGEYLENLKKNASSNMIFYGKSHNIIETIKALHIHISLVPSTVEESFGLVAIESMICSCLTIVSTNGELPNIAQKTQALTFNTQVDLLKKIQQLTQERPEQLSHLANSQFSLTKSNYNYDRFRINFIQLINSSKQ